MPLFDCVCDECRLLFRDELLRPGEEFDCPECGRQARRQIGQASMVGPTERHPEVYRGQGLAFTSARALREYQKKVPDARMVSKSDSAYKNMYERVRAQNEETAKKQGYRDWDHRARATPAEKAERRAAAVETEKKAKLAVTPES